MQKGDFTIIQEDPTIYVHNSLYPMIHIGTDIAEWATKCYTWVNTCSPTNGFATSVSRQQLSKHSQCATVEDVFQ
jgi:hypothetical protein